MTEFPMKVKDARQLMDAAILKLSKAQKAENEAERLHNAAQRQTQQAQRELERAQWHYAMAITGESDGDARVTCACEKVAARAVLDGAERIAREASSNG